MNVKTVVTVALTGVALAALSGCGGMGKGNVRDLNSAITDDPIDQVYVAQINSEAKRHFATIIWVNPPYKATAPNNQN